MATIEIQEIIDFLKEVNKWERTPYLPIAQSVMIDKKIVELEQRDK